MKKVPEPCRSAVRCKHVLLCSRLLIINSTSLRRTLHRSRLFLTQKFMRTPSLTPKRK